MEQNSRRGFLRNLAALPLIGGGVTLIGQPTAAAVPVTGEMLDSYNEWLFYERRLLCNEMYPGFREAERYVPASPAVRFHFPSGTSWEDVPKPSTRAAIVMSAVGCGWRRT